MKYFVKIFVFLACSLLLGEGILIHADQVSAALLNNVTDVTDDRLVDRFQDEIRSALPNTRSLVPIKKDPSRLGVELSAQSALVLDRRTGKVLFSKAPHEKRAVASITKLMTALVVKALNLNSAEAIDLKEVDRTLYGRYYLSPGSKIMRGDLLKLAIGASANNAAAALVRTSGLSEADFVRRMNIKASELGMLANFEDAIGLDPNNTSDAFGVARLLEEAMKFDDLQTAMLLDKVVVDPVGAKPYETVSTNELLDTFLNRAPYEIVGGKTGFIDEAGHCLVQTVRYGGHDIVVVVLGARDNTARFDEVKALAVWTFDAYSWEL